MFSFITTSKLPQLPLPSSSFLLPFLHIRFLHVPFLPHYTPCLVYSSISHHLLFLIGIPTFSFLFLASLAMTSITHHLHMFLFPCYSTLPLPNSPSYPYLPLQCFFSPSFDPPLVYPSISSTKINIY